jgi:hypothetical protein
MQLLCLVITVMMAGAYLWLWQTGHHELAHVPVWVIVVNSFVVSYAHARLGFWVGGFWVGWPFKPPREYPYSSQLLDLAAAQV